MRNVIEIQTPKRCGAPSAGRSPYIPPLSVSLRAILAPSFPHVSGVDEVDTAAAAAAITDAAWPRSILTIGCCGTSVGERVDVSCAWAWQTWL